MQINRKMGFITRLTIKNCFTNNKSSLYDIDNNENDV